MLCLYSVLSAQSALLRTQTYTYNILNVVPPVHVVSNHVDTDKLTTANGGTFTSSSASLSNQSRQRTLVADRACYNVIGY